jgi:hypothetical protein
MSGRLLRRSGAQPLAAAIAALGDNLASAGGFHPRPKTVTALAHQFAGLISPFHEQNLRCKARRKAGMCLNFRGLYESALPLVNATLTASADRFVT